MYFEDAVHGNPALKSNLNFWSARLRPGGILCGHDYGIKFPDVKREVDAIAASWKTTVHIVGSLWAMQKPRLGNHASDQEAGCVRGGMEDSTEGISAADGRLHHPTAIQ